MSKPTLYEELQVSLPESNAADRAKWAKQIIQEDLDVSQLLELATNQKEIASRFLWLLSDIAEVNLQTLQDILPALWALKEHIDPELMPHSFSKYWRLCGPAEEHEGEAIDLLFTWLTDPKRNITVKTNSMLALHQLTEKYPDLKNELRLSLESQLKNFSANFDKKVLRVLSQL